MESVTRSPGAWKRSTRQGQKDDRAMPRKTKTKRDPARQPEPQPETANNSPGEVLTLAESAAYLRLPESEVVRLVHSQGLPGRLIGGEWRFLKAAIQHWLSTGSPTPETRQAAQLAVVGSWK